MLLAFSIWGQIGVITIASVSGERIGPPAEREYAVEPVGVAIIIPSARYLQRVFSSLYAVKSILLRKAYNGCRNEYHQIKVSLKPH